MKSLPELYYGRLQGKWSWKLVIEIRSAQELFRHPLTGLKILLTCLWQRLAGPLNFWTEVGEVSDKGVEHKTRVSKWGITLFESLEMIDFDQSKVLVHGKQASWPLLSSKRPLGPFKGEITSLTAAEYDFEILSFPCLFKTNFEPEGGTRSFDGQSIRGQIELTDKCKKRLLSHR